MITKRKTSVSLSRTLLEELAPFNEKGNVSEFVEEALAFYLTHRKRAARRQREIDIINSNADLLNKRAKENLDVIDDALEHEISIKAEAFGLSRTETVKKVLADALLSGRIEEHRKMFAPFYGIWADKDAAEFKEATKDFETIDPGDWE